MRWTILLVLLAACGGGSPDGNTASGGFGVDVLSAEWHGLLGHLSPMNGRTFAVLSVKVSNASEARPVLANGALFSVTTKAAISVPISAALATLDEPCTDLSVARGGQLTCGLAFEVPTGDVPVTLVYDDRQGFEATSAIPEPVQGCDTAGWGGSQCMTCIGSAFFQCIGGTGPAGCTETEANCFVTKIPAGLCSAAADCGQSAACKQSIGAEAKCLIDRCASSCGS